MQNWQLVTWPRPERGTLPSVLLDNISNKDANVPDHYYGTHSKFYLSVDCVIFGFDEAALKLLVIRRNFEPEQGKWSLMGGFLLENETLDEAAKRILDELTGLSHVYLEQFHTYSDPDRDPGERVISTCYYAFLRIDDFNAELTQRHGASWFDLGDIPQLIFDHRSMVSAALEAIRQKNRFLPIGLELLPDKFTIPELQRLYEALYEKKFDNANFRKKIMSMKILKKLNEKERENSKKGAYLYQFDRNKFNKLEKNALLFQM